MLLAFNRAGYSSFSIRNMAGEVGLSHGNLRYHFSKKEDILLALLNQMVAEMDQLRSKVRGTTNILEQMYKGIAERFAIQYTYRFLFTDQAELVRHSVGYRDYLSELHSSRIPVMQEQLQSLAAMGLLHNKHLADIAHYMFLFSIHWLNSAQLFGNYDRQSAIQHFAKLCFDHLKPVLTVVGEKLYDEINFS